MTESNEELNNTEHLDEQQTPAEAHTSDNEETQVDNKVPYDRFKAKVDEANALKQRLAEYESNKAEEDRKALVEQNEYKTLYEQVQTQLETVQADALNVKKDSMLVQAGYSAEQTELLRRLIEGDSDEEINTSIEQLKATIPTQGKGVDPSPFNGRKDEVKPSDKEEIGASAYARIKGRLF